MHLLRRRRDIGTLRDLGSGVVATGRDGRIAYINPVAERLTGIPHAEAVGKTPDAVLQVCDVETGENVRDWLPRALAECRPAVVPRRAALLSRNGSVSSVDAAVTAIRDPGGAVVGALLMFYERPTKGTAKAIYAEPAVPGRLEKIAASSSGVRVAIRMSADGRFTMPVAGHAIEQLAGVTADRVIADAQAFFAVVDGRDVGDLRDSLVQSARSGLPWRCHFRVEPTVGTTRWLEVRVIPTAEARGATFWHGVLTDAGDRAEVDASLRACPPRRDRSAGVRWLASWNRAGVLRAPARNR